MSFRVGQQETLALQQRSGISLDCLSLSALPNTCDNSVSFSKLPLKRDVPNSPLGKWAVVPSAGVHHLHRRDRTAISIHLDSARSTHLAWSSRRRKIMKLRSILSSFAVVALGLALIVGHATAQGKKINKKQLVGTWMLVSADNMKADG